MVDMKKGRGIVAAAEPLAAGVGTDILRQGGNAIDAAVAIGFALAVTYPAAGNLGGGGFLVGSIGREKKQRSEVSLDFREVAPGAATSDMYTQAAAAGNRSASLLGHLAAGVPGSVSGMLTALERWGTMTRRQVIEPARLLAQGGFLLPARTHRMLVASKKSMLRFEATADTFFPDGEVIEKGKLFRQPDLARTLEIIIERGIAGFYDGEVADHIVIEMKRGGGLISAKDLLDYRPVERKPIRFPISNGSAVSMPPPSSGGICLAQMSRMLKRFNIGSTDAESPQLYHLLAEVMRLSFADRNQYLGDPDHVACPLEMLQDKKRLDRLAATIDRSSASSSADLLKGSPPVKESEQTTHYSVIDSHGNGVAVTTTLNGSFGSKVLVPAAGFLLNNEMDDFTAHPGEPNLFGLIQGSANAVAPGKRPLSSMSPTVLLDEEGNVDAVLGTPGGPTIITNVFQVLLGLTRLGLSPENSITAPKIHHQCLPDRIFLEATVPTSTEQSLLALGHQCARRSAIGDFQLIARTPHRGLVGVADPRGGGVVSNT